MTEVEVVELVRSAQRAGVAPAAILDFLDAIALLASLTKAVAVAPKRPDYSDN